MMAAATARVLDELWQGKDFIKAQVSLVEDDLTYVLAGAEQSDPELDAAWQELESLPGLVIERAYYTGMPAERARVRPELLALPATERGYARQLQEEYLEAEQAYWQEHRSAAAARPKLVKTELAGLGARIEEELAALVNEHGRGPAPPPP